jgi:hypothetical protein
MVKNGDVASQFTNLYACNGQLVCEYVEVRDSGLGPEHSGGKLWERQGLDPCKMLNLQSNGRTGLGPGSWSGDW